jgi:hypothetical protein
LQFQFVDEIEEVLDMAFGEALKKREWSSPAGGSPPGDRESENEDGSVVVVSVSDDEIEPEGDTTIRA